jgi:hypothetical protein
MQLSIISYNGHLINDTTNYEAYFPVGTVMTQPSMEIKEINRPDMQPIYAGKILKSIMLPIEIILKGVIATQIDTLKNWLDAYDPTPYILLVKDIANSNKQWYVMGVVASQPETEGNRARFILSVQDPVWRSDTLNSSSWAITASGQIKEITIAGNKDAYPILEITPTSAGGTGFAYRRWIALYACAAKTMKNYPVNVCGTTLDTAALVTASKMQADGDDLRVYMDGAETPRWLQGINTTTTKVWMVGDWHPQVKATGPAVGAGALTSITFQASIANKNALANLAKWGGKSFTLYVGTEAITFDAAVINGRVITATITRGAKGTTAATHAAGDVWYWVEHDVWMYYGNASMTAPDQDESKKPILSLTSTNTSWIYTEFTEAAGVRAGDWIGALLDTDNKRDTDYCSQIYTGSRLAAADPATEMGMSIQAFRSNSAWKAEQASLVWTLHHPCGVTTITASGEKYRYTTAYPVASFQKSSDGSTWSKVWTDVTPTALQTWEALAAHTSVALGATYNWIRFVLSGPQPAVSGAQAEYSIQDVTLTLDSTFTPAVTLGAEQSCYHLQATITNYLGPTLTANGGFETAGAGGADVFASWVEVAGDGAIANETTLVHSGGHAAKLTAGATANTDLSSFSDVTPGNYLWRFYTRGDGTYQGRVAIYDVTHGWTFLLPYQNTGVAGTVYTLVSIPFVVPAGCFQIMVKFVCSATNGGICYFDDADVFDITNSESITLNAAFPLNTTLTVDTDARTVKLADGTNLMAALSWSSVRKDWLKMPMGVNTLQYDDASTNGVTIVTRWRDRNS